jgi:hypothetical protein
MAGNERFLQITGSPKFLAEFKDLIFAFVTYRFKNIFSDTGDDRRFHSKRFYRFFEKALAAVQYFFITVLQQFLPDTAERFSLTH